MEQSPEQKLIPVSKLNIGCGKNIMERPWCNLDVEQLEGVDCVFDLNRLGMLETRFTTEGPKATGPARLPFSDDTFEELLMSHILEHLPRPLDVMQELHRVARPDALLTVRVPYGASDAAFEDPQHIRQYFLQSFEYFSQPCYWKADYGYRGDWQTVSRTLVINRKLPMVQGLEGDLDNLLQLVMHARNIVMEFYIELKCVKPIRQPQRELGVASPIQFTFIDGQ